MQFGPTDIHFTIIGQLWGFLDLVQPISVPTFWYDMAKTRLCNEIPIPC
jgi:hypothetical protein